MSNEQNAGNPAPNPDVELTQAFKELQRGEMTAAALENHLDTLERKIEELVAQAEKVDQEMKARPALAPDKSLEDDSKSGSRSQ